MATPTPVEEALTALADNDYLAMDRFRREVLHLDVETQFVMLALFQSKPHLEGITDPVEQIRYVSRVAQREAKQESRTVLGAHAVYDQNRKRIGTAFVNSLTRDDGSEMELGHDDLRPDALGYIPHEDVEAAPVVDARDKLKSHYAARFVPEADLSADEILLQRAQILYGVSLSEAGVRLRWKKSQVERISRSLRRKRYKARSAMMSEAAPIALIEGQKSPAEGECTP